MSKWTENDIPDQSGRTVLVTGANSGLGFHTARALAEHGAKVLMGCRSLERGTEALGRIKSGAPNADLTLIELDLADLASVEAAAAEVTRTTDALDILVNNAGLMAIPRTETADGFEMQLGTNHLGHFALTGRLFEALLQADAPRIVTVSSQAHRQGEMNFDDLQSERSYNRWKAYGQSKLANLLFHYELDRRLNAADVHITAVAAHPGYSATNLQSVGPKMGSSFIDGIVMKIGNAVIAQSEEKGTLPQLYAATSPEVRSGDYIGPDGIAEARGYPRKVDPAGKALDPEAGGRLWKVSEELTGVEFGMIDY